MHDWTCRPAYPSSSTETIAVGVNERSRPEQRETVAVTRPTTPTKAAEAASSRGSRRPAQRRREQIVSTASRLFAARGYSGVGIDDIGAELGISGPALYRHFPGKEAVLAEIIIGLVDDLVAASRAAIVEATDATDTLERLIAAVVGVCVDRPADVVVTMRSVWHVSADFSAGVLARWNEIIELWRPTLRHVLPKLDMTDAELYVRAGAGLAVGTTRSRPAQPHARLVEMSTRMTAAMLRAQLAAITPEAIVTHPRTSSWARSSRREQILDAAIGLFRDQGFRGVSMREIGAAVGISGSAAYRHFTSKEDILATAVTRVGERVTNGLSEALSSASSAEDALDRLLRSYITICVRNHELIAVATSEAHHLSADQLRDLRRHQRLFRDEWIHCLGAARPDIPAGEVGAVVAGIVGLVTETTRSRRIERRADLDEDLFRLARAAIYA
jgi:AcrR family transcriptional regulator